MKKIVLTGGPCAGKTTGLNYVVEQLEKWGFTVTVVPEVATLIITNGGISPNNWRIDDQKRYERFEEFLLQMQVRIENQFKKLVKIRGGKKRVLLCDRGAMDVRAYCDGEQFDTILRRNRLTKHKLLERYDGVIHLVTAADGKEQCYSRDNNKARYEDAEEARIADQHIKAAWLGHPHLRIIDNSTLFKGKMKRLVKTCQRLLGFPVSVEIEKKFVLKKPIATIGLPVPHQDVYIQQAYLEDPHTRIRKRVQDTTHPFAQPIYYRTEKVPTQDPLIREEREEQISEREYQRLMLQRDMNREVIEKIRTCFIWKNQYFELDHFFSPCRLQSLALLEIELTEKHDTVTVPSWLGKVREVTDDPLYGNYELAKKK